MSWNLRYAAHLGFRSPEAPLFPWSAGSSDPLAQIDFAASIGLAGVQDPWFASRPPPAQAAIAARLREQGLAAGCIVCGSPAAIRTPLWTGSDGAARANLERELNAALAAAERLGSRQIVVLTGVDTDAPRPVQIDRFISNLAWAAPRFADEGLTLCLESLNARAIPGMLMNHFPEGCDIARAVGHPAVRMIFDTAHVQSMDGDLLNNLERAFDLIEVVQIANHPGRTEPEIGEINMAVVLTRVHELGHRGLVELEHFWARPGQQAERRALDWLRRVDAALGAPPAGKQAADVVVATNEKRAVS
jgi:hydroxypyruvate isomerase